MRILSVFKALSDLTRLRMLRLLVVKRREICVGEFVESLQGQPYNISKQLKLLEQTDLVLKQKQGRHVFYRLASNDVTLAAEIFQLIENIPDSEGYFSKDLSRFENKDRHEEVLPVVEDVPFIEESLPSNLL